MLLREWCMPQQHRPPLPQEVERQDALVGGRPARVVPVKGVEPSTFALRMRCSTN